MQGFSPHCQKPAQFAPKQLPRQSPPLQRTAKQHSQPEFFNQLSVAVPCLSVPSARSSWWDARRKCPWGMPEGALGVNTTTARSCIDLLMCSIIEEGSLRFRQGQGPQGHLPRQAQEEEHGTGSRPWSDNFFCRRRPARGGQFGEIRWGPFPCTSVIPLLR